MACFEAHLLTLLEVVELDAVACGLMEKILSVSVP